MNVNDVKIAAEALVGEGTASPYEGVHVVGTHGAERINGLDVKETNNFAGVYVLDSSGNPAVSSRVVFELEAEIERLEGILRDAYEEIRRDRNIRAIDIIAEWGGSE